jgi:ubiquinone/menaquinone biosynthesis C-methylase UbiE
MMQRSTGFWRLLGRPAAYDAMQALSGAGRMLDILLADHIRARPGDRVLDLGCGTARVASRMADVSYVGIDANAA